MKNLVLSFAVLILLISCGEKPKFVGIKNISIDGIKDSVMLVSMDYVIYNPNNVKTKLKQSDMTIYYQDTLVGIGYLDNRISLQANDTVKIPVKCKIDLDKLNMFYPQLLNSDSSMFKIKGESKVSFLLKSFDIDIDDNINLNTKKIIHDEISKNIGSPDNFKIKSIAMRGLPALGQTNFKMEIDVKNNLSFDYKLNSMQLHFFINPKKPSIANWNLDQAIWQKSSATANIPVNVSINNLSILNQADLSWLFDKRADFRIIGEAEILIQDYTFSVPINDKITVDLKTLSGF